MTNEEFEASDERVHKWLTGFIEGMTSTNHKLIPLIEQLCRDLNEAHNEILRQQGVAEADFNKYDWPEWSAQANSIRWAERETKVKLAKTSNWTLYPKEPETPIPQSKAGRIDSLNAPQVQCADCLAWTSQTASHTCRQQIQRNKRNTEKRF